MKNSIFILFIALSTALNAQISLENTYNGSAYITDIEEHGIKYFDMDVVNNVCNLYNPDHSLWKNISLNVPLDNYLSDIRYVTSDLFNTDELVELSYTYYHYDTVNQYYTYTTQIINENSSVLLTVAGATYVEVVSAGNADFKFLAYVWDYAVLPPTLQTLVYDLPGEPDFIPELKSYLGDPYPNPASDVIHVPLSKDHKGGMINLMDGSGKIIRKFPANSRIESMDFNLGEFAAGSYYLQFVSGRKTSAIKKIIKQ